MAIWDDISSKNLNLKIGDLRYIDDAAGKGFETTYEMGDLNKGYSDVSISDGYLNFDGYNIRSPRQNNIGPAGFYKEVPNHDPVRAELIRRSNKELLAREFAGFDSQDSIFDQNRMTTSEFKPRIGTTNATLDDFDNSVAAKEVLRKNAWLSEQEALKAERYNEYNNSRVLGKANLVIQDQASDIYDSIANWFSGGAEKVKPEGYTNDLEDVGGAYNEISDWASGFLKEFKGFSFK